MVLAHVSGCFLKGRARYTRGAARPTNSPPLDSLRFSLVNPPPLLYSLPSGVAALQTNDPHGGMDSTQLTQLTPETAPQPVLPPKLPSLPTSLPGSEDFLIDKVFPHPDIHIICGPSGGGKTTLLGQMLQVWSQGGLWFGHQCYPLPFAYISGERTKRGVTRTLERLGLDQKKFTVVGSTELPKGITLAGAVAAALKRKPDARVFIVEGLVRFVPGGKISDPHVVLNFLVDMQRICEAKGVSFLLVTWSPKQKEGERYTNPRQQAMGSVAFAGCCETIVLIEPYKEEEIRAVSILMKNSKDEYYYMAFDGANGALKQIAAPGQQSLSIKEYILNFDNGFVFAPDDLADSFPEMNRKLFSKCISQLLQENEIARVCRGRYRRTRAYSPPELPPGISPNSLVVSGEGQLRD